MLGRFGRLGNEVESFRLTDDSSTLIPAKIQIVDSNGNPIPQARVELRFEDKIISVGTTNLNGVATLKAPEGYSYTLTVSGDRIETMVINDFSISDTQITVEEKKYLELKPEYLWLNPANNFKDNVNVYSNIAWKLT